MMSSAFGHESSRRDAPKHINIIVPVASSAPSSRIEARPMKNSIPNTNAPVPGATFSAAAPPTAAKAVPSVRYAPARIARTL